MTMLEKVAKALYEHGYVGDWPPTREVDLNMDATIFARWLAPPSKRCANLTTRCCSQR